MRCRIGYRRSSISAGGCCDPARPDAPRRGERPTRDTSGRDHRCRPDRARRSRTPAGTRHRLRDLRGRRPGSGERARSGDTLGCSRRGSTWSTLPRVVCSRRRAGSCRTPSALRPGRNWSRSTSPRWLRWSRSPPARAPGSRCIGVTREGMDRTRTRGTLRHAVRAPDPHRRRSDRGRRRSRGDRRLGHLSVAELAVLERA